MSIYRYKIFAAAAVAASLVVAGPVQAQPYGPGMMGGYGPGYGMMGGGYGGGYGPGYGPGIMGGYGPGWMMGGGYGPGWGPGMMGGYGPGNYGGQGNLNLTTDNVKAYLERMLAVQGNPRLKVGDVKEKDADTIVADIVTKDKDALVQRFAVDRHTGFYRPEEN
jgi:hypothetical protein